MTVTCAGAFPPVGLTVSQLCDGNTAKPVLFPVIETFKVCETELPPTKAERFSDVGLTVTVCALAVPAAISVKGIRIFFNVFKSISTATAVLSRNAPVVQMQGMFQVMKLAASESSSDLYAGGTST